MYIYQLMSNNFGSIDIILLAMIAGFIILRLRNILGRKNGHEDEVFKGFSEKKFEQFKKENFKKNKEDDHKLEGEQKKQFLKGAESAYETIITSFAKGDRKQLKPLLSSEMYLNFDSAIAQREKDSVKSELTFIGIKETNLEHFEKIKNELYTTVKFVSEIISVKKDNQNKIIEGNSDKIKQVTDYWKFSKNIFNRNPNWYLSEIISK
jgi:hypothetical protein|tara:strand:+ start:4997 stop:5620 length:624 start_codon:yes stop_codon:yes gene_type:complete